MLTSLPFSVAFHFCGGTHDPHVFFPFFREPNSTKADHLLVPEPRPPSIHPGRRKPPYGLRWGFPSFCTMCCTAIERVLGGGTPSTSCSAHPSPYNGNVRRPFPYPYCLLCRQRVSVQNICMLEKGSALHCLRIWRSNLCVGQRNKTANKTVNAHPVFCMHHAFVKVCCAGDSSTEIF